jgi:hypothetical protein
VAAEVTLSQIPENDAYVIMTVYGGVTQDEGVDFNVTGTILSWNGTSIDGVLEVGDKLQIAYSY